MNWAFELLGLRPDADAASVKRAYARLLRTTRPDEDPEAFQRLHAAYKMVLAQVERKTATALHSVPATIEQAGPSPQAAAPVPAAASPASPAQVRTANATAPAIHLGTLADEVICAAMGAENSNALSRWLQGRPEFWSIQVKQQAGHLVLQRLFQQPRAISAECMDALLQFFDLDHVLSGVNPVAIHALRIRQRTLHELLPQNHHELARRVGVMQKGRPDILLLRKNLALLERPLNWLQAAMASMQSNRGHSLAKLVGVLSNNGRFDELPASIDRQHATFWFRGATRGPLLTRERFMLNSLRACAWAFATLLGVAGLGTMAAGTDGIHWSEIARISGILSASILMLWLLFAGCWWFDQWQGVPESTPSRWPWLRRLTIPALCTVGLAVYEIGDMPYMSGLVVLCFIFALRKIRRRPAVAGGFFTRITSSTPALIWIGVMTMSALSRMQDMKDFPFIPAVALVTFAMSIADLWLHRAYLHPKLARN